MAKVKKCLDSGCIEYILLEDNTCIQQPKEKCDFKKAIKQHSDEDFQKQFEELVSQIENTIYVTKHKFDNYKVGEELKL